MAALEGSSRVRPHQDKDGHKDKEEEKEQEQEQERDQGEDDYYYLQDPSSHGTPVYVTVWSLLPPSLLSSAMFTAGVAMLHTNVWLPDCSLEVAFGGHDLAGLSGISSITREKGRLKDGSSHLGPYAIPAPGDPPLPGSHYVGAWFLGYAGEPPPAREKTEVAAGAANVRRSATGTDSMSSKSPSQAAPVATQLGRQRRDDRQADTGPTTTTTNASTGRFAASQWGFGAYREPRSFCPRRRTARSSGVASAWLQGTQRAVASWWFNSGGGEGGGGGGGGGDNGARVGGSNHPDASVVSRRTTREHEGGEPDSSRPPSSPTAPATSHDDAAARRAYRHPRHRGVRARSIAFALRSISEFKASPDWHGPRYHVLERNCNHFTSSLVSHLTGAALPSFVNRAASIASQWLPTSLVELSLESAAADVEGGVWGDAEEQEEEEHASAFGDEGRRRAREGGEDHAAEGGAGRSITASQ